MNRRDLLKSTLLAAGAVSSRGAIAESFLPQKQQQKKKISKVTEPTRENPGQKMPNILWICTDQQRADTLQGLNNTHIRTPHLQKFMSESVTFTNTFAQCPICSPSRASFLTGRYSHCTGLTSNGQRIRETEQLVTRVLADQGYDCGLVGKLHLSPCAGGMVEDRIDDGYRVFEWSHDISNNWPGKNMWRVWLDRQGVKWPAMPPPLRKNQVWGVPVDPKYTQTAWCSDVAIDFMRGQKKDKPWLMSVNIFQPHHAFVPTEEYLSHYDPDKLPSPAYKEGELESKPVFQRIDHNGAYGGTQISFAAESDKDHRKTTAAYYAMIEQVDTEVGRMLAALEETGQAEDTIVIFMSDHGEMLGDHGIYLKGPYFYDCLTRVPLIIRWPKKYKAGLKVDALVELVDLAPTLLDAAGITGLQGMQGQTLTPLLTGETLKHRDSVYTEFYDAVATYKPKPMATCVRTDKHKLAYYQTVDTGELYDLEKDPGEVNNLWNTVRYSDVQTQMMQRLLARMIASTDPLPIRQFGY